MAQLTQPLDQNRGLVPTVTRRRGQAFRLPLRIALDFGLIALGFWLAYIVRYELEFPEQVSRNAVVDGVFIPGDYRAFTAFLPALGMLAGLLLLVFTVRGVYRLSRWTGFLDEALLIASSSILGFSALIVVVFYYRPLYFSRLIFFFAFVLVVGLLLAERAIRHGTIAWMHARGRWTDRVLVVGAGPAGERVMSALIGERRYDLVGFVDDAPLAPDWAIATEYTNIRPDRLGATHELPEAIRRHEIDEVIIALPATAHDQLYWAIEQCRIGGVPFTLLPDLFELSLDRVEIHSLNGLPLISTQDAGLRSHMPVTKRIFDIACAGIGLLVSGIPMLLIALLIRIDSPGAALYGQTRIGRGGRRFTCYKFRSMYVGAHQQRDQLLKSASYTGDRVAFKMKDDPRVTRIGRWLRKTSLDELPNLFNVLRGEMSIVGPRPHVPDEVDVYEPWHRQRLAITPGMTCLWQVNGRSDLSFDEQVRFDLYYAERWSLWLDIKIILRTFPAVLTRRGAY